jgi:hypothetical protein
LTAAVALLAPFAAANPPEKISGTVDVQPTLSDYCSFDIAIDAHVDFVTKNFSDSSGTPVRTQIHIHEQDVFSANGISLTGLPFSFTLDFYFASDGTQTKAKSVGVAEKIPLPDGTLFIVAGYLDLFTQPPGTDFFISITHGNPGDSAALCAALTP